MAKLDPFTKKRLAHFAETHRATHGQLPTLRDFFDNGFSKEQIANAVKEKVLQELYVTMTTGAVVKGYKVCKE